MEKEADYVGLLLMARAGYDPRAAPSVYKLRMILRASKWRWLRVRSWGHGGGVEEGRGRGRGKGLHDQALGGDWMGGDPSSGFAGKYVLSTRWLDCCQLRSAWSVWTWRWNWYGDRTRGMPFLFYLFFSNISIKRLPPPPLLKPYYLHLAHIIYTLHFVEENGIW